MRQTIPFRKDITFKTKIGEITAISLDNDLELQGEDLIKGNFYISGNYKMLESSTILEDYSYKIPCEIAISDDYDTFDASLDIDDFYYEIIDDEILRVNIVVAINDLKRKEVTEEKEEDIDDELFEDDELDRALEIYDHDYNKNIESDIEDLKDEDKGDEKKEEDENMDRNEIKNDSDERDNAKVSFYEVKENVKNQTDTYLTYKVYVFKDGDSIEDIIEKYKVTKDDLLDYNDLDNLTVGTKLVIPSSND